MSEHMTFPAEGRPADAWKSSTGCARAFVAKGVTQAAPDRRRTAGAARHHDAGESLSRHLGSGALDELTLTTNGSQLAKYAAELKASRRRAHQRLARHARSRTNSAPSPAGAISTRCWPGSTPRRRPACKSRSTRWRSRASTRTNSPHWSNGRTAAAWT